MRKIIVGSRQSALALTQTGHVIADLERLSEEHGFGFTFEVKRLLPKGTASLMSPCPRSAAKGCS